MKPLIMSCDAVVTVGNGRGFLVRGSRVRPTVIVTAAHCLPKVPPAISASLTYERTCLKLVGKLFQKPTIGAECLFVDPVADIAVLGRADDQEFPEDADRWDELVETRRMSVGPVRSRKAYVLTLGGKWFPCTANMTGNSLWVDTKTENGMSGSPVIDSNGKAIGVVVIGGEPSGPNPILVKALPGWLLPH